MKFITVSELRADAPKIVAELQRTAEEVVITKNGKPVAILQRATEADFILKRDDDDNERGDNNGNKGGIPEGKGVVDSVHRTRRHTTAGIKPKQDKEGR